jgi:hypothetical protein
VGVCYSLKDAAFVVKEVEMAIVVDLVLVHIVPQIVGYGNDVLALHGGVCRITAMETKEMRRQTLLFAVFVMPAPRSLGFPICLSHPGDKANSCGICFSRLPACPYIYIT